MAMQDSATQYGSVSKSTHWLLLLFIVTQFALGFSFDIFPDDSTGHKLVLTAHASNGLLIFCAGTLFAVWRSCNPRPSLSQIEPWQRKLASVVHLFLFAAIVLQPMLGIGVMMTGGEAVPFFGLFTIPPPLPESENARDAISVVHEGLAFAILAVLALHVLGAMYHHFIARDAILRRMLPGGEPSKYQAATVPRPAMPKISDHA